MGNKADIVMLDADQRRKIGFEKSAKIGFLKKLFDDIMRRLWKFFTSIKLSVVLLLSLAASSVIGTLIPQNQSPVRYIRSFGEYFYRIFNMFDLFDMYHSWWFQLLFLMIVANIVVCSIDRLSTTWKVVFVKVPRFNISRFKKLSGKVEFTDHRPPEQLQKAYEPFIAKRFGYSRVETIDGGVCIFAEKWRWTRFGVYTVHLSVLLLLVGGLLGSFFGFDGYVNIPVDESVNTIKIKGSEQIRPLDFDIRCDDFNVSFYDSGAPKEYRSNLSIIEDGKLVMQKNIVVNDPLRYKGISIYQSSYGTVSPRELTLSFTSNKTGRTYQKNTIIGQTIEVPEGMGTFTVKGYRESTAFKGHNIGKAFLGTLTPKNGRSIFILLPLQYPSFDRMRKGSMVVSLTGYKKHYYTGLKVANDPGVWIVYTGFVVMIIGIYITFFMSHQRICIEIARGREKSAIMVAGISNKNTLGMETKIKKIATKLANLDQRTNPVSG